jgi:hypothetical protein
MKVAGTDLLQVLYIPILLFTFIWFRWYGLMLNLPNTGRSNRLPARENDH